MLFFFFNDTATTEIYTLSLHDALPISRRAGPRSAGGAGRPVRSARPPRRPSPPSAGKRRLASGRPSRAAARSGREPRSEEHTSELQSANISYAVFCLKKKKLKVPTSKF